MARANLAEKHPEWFRRNADGTLVDRGEDMPGFSVGNAFVPTCQFTSYFSDFIPAIIKEVIGRNDIDPLAPQREAAIFYGLFLRGHSADDLRRDIDVPRPLLHKWLQPRRYDEGFRESLREMYTYRKRVLAIFDELILKEKHRIRVN